jgi:hypothetical protein
MADRRKVKEALLPMVLGHLEGLERELTGACTGWGPNASGMKSVRSAIGYLRQIVDPRAWTEFRTHLAHQRMCEEQEKDPAAWNAWWDFRYGDWKHPPPERHRRKRAALQAEVDELYRSDRDG